VLFPIGKENTRGEEKKYREKKDLDFWQSQKIQNKKRYTRGGKGTQIGL